MAPMLVTETLRQQKCQWPTDRLLAGVTENRLGALIVKRDPLRRIDRDDRVGSDLENCCELGSGKSGIVEIHWAHLALHCRCDTRRNAPSVNPGRLFGLIGVKFTRLRIGQS